MEKDTRDWITEAQDLAKRATAYDIYMLIRSDIAETGAAIVITNARTAAEIHALNEVIEDGE